MANVRVAMMRTSEGVEDGTRSTVLVARAVQVLVDCAVPEQLDSFFRVTSE